LPIACLYPPSRTEESCAVYLSVAPTLRSRRGSRALRNGGPVRVACAAAGRQLRVREPLRRRPAAGRRGEPVRPGGRRASCEPVRAAPPAAGLSSGAARCGANGPADAGVPFRPAAADVAAVPVRGAAAAVSGVPHGRVRCAPRTRARLTSRRASCPWQMPQQSPFGAPPPQMQPSPFGAAPRRLNPRPGLTAPPAPPRRVRTHACT
jgi:hypothetical protein